LGEFLPVGRPFYLGSFVKITEIAQLMGVLFHDKCCVLIFTRNGFGYILGDFFTNASGHPGPGFKIACARSRKEPKAQ
jgi:hypothetical protein